MSTLDTANPADRLGRIGVWSIELRYSEPAVRADAAAELEDLGFGAAWIPGGAGGDILEVVENVLGATRRMTVATGILNIWKHETSDVGDWWRGLSADRQGRTMLGLGVSHAPMIGEAYRAPVATMRAYLDRLDAEGVPAERRCLAALGPKMLDLALERSAGAHPYLVSPEHTAQARQRLGAGPILAPEQGVILETDPATAREIARQALAVYLKFPNYVNNWRRLGFSEEDVTKPSDGLCDALFAWGDLDRIAERVNAHLDAGADHVCLQVVQAGERGDASVLRESWRRLASVLM